jgi:hypothetical protein
VKISPLEAIGTRLDASVTFLSLTPELLCKRVPQWLLCGAATIVWSSYPAMADDSVSDREIPSFTELQASGAIIGEIRIETLNIFNLDDPAENNALFRAANAFHIRTRPSLIMRMLLFHSGEPVSVRLIEETERLLRTNAPIYDVSIEPVAYHDGFVDIAVTTHDTWTLQPGISFSRTGGTNSNGLALKEQNLFGTGISFGMAHTSSVDRSGSEFEFSDNHAFDGWTTISLAHASYSDGSSESLVLDRPFYALDTRWAAGVSASKFERTDSIYNGGNISGQYRHHQDRAQAYGGWSRGLIDGWTQRYSVGVDSQTDTYQFDPSLSPPVQPPPDQTLAGPFVRYELVEDNYLKVMNRDRIQRPEYFAMGFQSLVQVGRALPDFGSTQNPWLVSAAVSDGFRVLGRHDLLTSGSISRQYGNETGDRRALSGSAHYYVPQSPRALFYAAASADAIDSPNAADQLQLGGDNGLRGYPLRYQTGSHRALMTVEERIYTDWYPFRLFRVGGAVYYDIGRAWGGPTENTANTRWLSDIGCGLRIVSDRSSAGNVLHVDIAIPINNHDPTIASHQLLFKMTTSF